MDYTIGLVIISPLLLAGFCLWLVEMRRNRICKEHKKRRAGHIPPRPIPVPRDMPPPPPAEND